MDNSARRQVARLLLKPPIATPYYFVQHAFNAKGSQYSITERRVLEPIPVLGSQPAGDVSHRHGGRLPLLSTGPAATRATLKRAATISLLSE